MRKAAYIFSSIITVLSMISYKLGQDNGQNIARKTILNEFENLMREVEETGNPISITIGNNKDKEIPLKIYPKDVIKSGNVIETRFL